MKKIYQAILLFIAASVLTYFVVAFGEWQINPKIWNESTRHALSLLIMLYAIMSYPIIQTLNEK